MTTTPATNTPNQKVLPRKTRAAMQYMISLTESTLQAFEAESNALAMQSSLDYIDATNTKQDVNAKYQCAAKEFMARQSEFLANNTASLRELTQLQQKLSTAIKLNMTLIEKANQSQEQD
jgi:hypothetical protein